jgi:malate dehydrogenase (oxaloacetate-decarboxylating)
VFSGAGAAGVAITKLLIKLGVSDVILCDRKGIICKGDPRLTPDKEDIASYTNPRMAKGSLADAMKGADIFVGVSAPGVVTPEMVSSMADNAIVMAMSNPVPEIMPELAIEAGAAVVGTGRSDYPNQINNVLAFPGIFRGALDVRASDINDEMKIAAAYAIAGLISDTELTPEYVLPKAFDKRVGPAVAQAVAQAARDTGVARI